MNLLHLKYAVEVAKTGSITQAAENLFMGQPNLSKAIKDLETSLGITIFRRSSRGVVPTKQGMTFLEYAKRIITEINEVENLYRKREDTEFKLRISVINSMYASLAFSNFSQVFSNYKEFEVEFKETDTADVIHDVAAANFNLGIIRYPIDEEEAYLELLSSHNLRTETLMEFEAMVLLSKNDFLAQRDEIDLDNLYGYIEILEDDSFIPELTDIRSRRKIGRPFLKQIYMSSRSSQLSTISSHEKMFMLTSPIPDEILEEENLVQKKIQGTKQSYRDALVYAEDYKITDLDKLYIDEVKNVIANKLSF